MECIEKSDLPPFDVPRNELTIEYEFAERPGMPPVTVYWYHHADGDAYLPPGMTTVEEARKMPGEGPQVGPVQGQGGFRMGTGGAGPAQAQAARPAARPAGPANRSQGTT
ncbi:MAG: hypothetical protein QM757_23350 [Paludibaculum sp.]